MSWSDKYKRSIDCDNPRGFSQRAHCQGLEKREEANHSEGRMPRLSQLGGWDAALESAAREQLEARFAECLQKREQSPRQQRQSRENVRQMRQEGGGFDNMPQNQLERIARKGGEAPRRQRCEDTVDNSESLDFAKGTGIPCGASYISAAKECRLGASERRAIIDSFGVKGDLKKRIEALDDKQLSRVAEGVKQGLSSGQSLRASQTVDTLSATTSGKRQAAGVTLQDPGNAAKYVKFYENGGDKTYKAPHNTSEAEVNFVIDRMRAEGAWGKVRGKLDGKGTPEAGMRAEAWGDQPKDARAKAVLKSLMDNDFQDVNGTFLPWSTGMQLDHRLAGSMGGKDSPNNWIWVSTATNQTKGNIEAAVRAKGLKGKAAEDYVNTELIKKLKQNASMSADEVARIKGAGNAAAAAKAERRKALKENMPLMTQQQIAEQLGSAKTSEMKDLLQASVQGNAGAAWVKKGGSRGQTTYPTVSQGKSLVRMRWGFELDNSDLKNIGQAIASSKNDSRPRSEILKDVEARFGPANGLTPAQRQAILAAAGGEG
jgi:hypothetical protein